MLKLSELASIGKYVNDGLTFEPLLNEMAQLDFFISLELTDKEPNSVMNAQMMMQILCKVQIIDTLSISNSNFEDVNDLDSVPLGEEGSDHPRERFGGPATYYDTRRVADLANEEWYYN